MPYGFAAQFLELILWQSPVLILYLVGIGLGLSRWSRYPKASALTLIGMSICLAASLGFAAVFVWLPTSGVRSSMGVGGMNNLYTICGVVNSLVHALGLALVLAAVFVGRASQYQPGFAVEMGRGNFPTPPLPPPFRRPGQG